MKINNINFSSVSIDSRNIMPGQLFVAISGEHFDGHNFVEVALEKGAVGAIVSESFFEQTKLQKEKLIPALNTQIALRKLATDYRNSWTFPVIALTGSCGKTSTKEMIASVLGESYQVFVTPGNKNNYLGVPLSIMACDQKNELAVFELGANHIGEIRENVHLVKPKIALITNVGVAHIGEFGGVEAIFSAKSEIFENLPIDGVAIYNADDVFAERWKKMLINHKTLTFGLSEKADIRATAIEYDELMCPSFDVITPKGSIVIKLSVVGEHNIKNALATIAVSLACDISLEKMVTGLEKYTGFARRLTFRKGVNGSRVIDDSYNANLKSVEAAIQVLAGFSGKRFLVLGDMGELGEWAVEHHQLIGIKASELGLDGLFTCGTLSQHAGESFQALSQPPRFHEHFSHQQDLSEKLKNCLDAQTTVVVKGSLSSHMDDVVARITL